jgi:hypothetical protein
MHTKTDANQAEDISMLEAVNGVPVAVKDETVVAVKGEPVVELRVELKRSHHSVTASDPV